VTKRGGMTTLAGGETPPGEGEGGDDVSWADMNFTDLKNKENSRG
jgi:hypothetical protein